MKKYFKLTILTFAIILLAGCSYFDSFEEAVKEQYNDDQNSKFTLSEDTGYADEFGFAYYIEGKVTNNTSRTYSYVQIELNVYDSENNLLGSCLDNINNLEANGTWKIKALCSGDAKSVDHYELKGFSSW